MFLDKMICQMQLFLKICRRLFFPFCEGIPTILYCIRLYKCIILMLHLLFLLSFPLIQECSWRLLQIKGTVQESRLPIDFHFPCTVHNVLRTSFNQSTHLYFSHFIQSLYHRTLLQVFIQIMRLFLYII